MSDQTKHLLHAWTARCAVALLAAAIALFETAQLSAQIKAAGRGPAKPAWDKGILPISAESYWNAVECGKQGGEDPPCVFFDTGLCKNDDYTLALFTPYKMVAYEVWRVVRQKQPAPTPSFQEAQRTRITIGVTLARGSQNPLTGLTLKRDGKAVAPVDRSLGEGGGRFTFDYPAWAATADVTLELAGRAKTITCVIEKPVLTLFR
jgi:hypothetical protein